MTKGSLLRRPASRLITRTGLSRNIDKPEELQPSLGRREEAMPSMYDLLARFGSATEPALRERVTWAKRLAAGSEDCRDPAAAGAPAALKHSVDPLR